MSVTADNVRQSATPNKWQIGKLTLACSVMGGGLLGFCTGALLFGKYRLGLGIEALQTLAMIALVFGGEAALYSIRERRHMWSSRPGTWVIVATIGDILIISVLMLRGIAMHPLPLTVVASMLSAAIAFSFLLDLIKVPVFPQFQIV
jgi:H+-transporting ATPase